MKKLFTVVSAILIMSMMFAFTASALTVKEVNPADIIGEPTVDTPSSWAATDVKKAIDSELVPWGLQHGYQQTITRAEFCELAVVLYEKVKGEAITERKAFDDTKIIAVEKAGALDIVGGVGDNKFNPNGTLSREQAATLLANLAKALGKPFDESAPTFADNASVASWASASVGKVQAVKLMGGVGSNKFDPKGEYTREQGIITMLKLFDIVK